MAGDTDRSGPERFDRRQLTTLKTAVAIGSTVTIGLSIFLLLGLVYQEAGLQTPASYTLTIFFFFLPILTIAERAGATSGRGGLYSLIRPSQSMTISFATGWLLIGGILFLISIFAWEGGLALQHIFTALFDYQVDGRWLSTLILLLVLPRILTRSESPWRKRTFLVYAATLVIIILLVGTWRTTIVPSTAYVYLPSSSLAVAAPFLIISLWSMQFITDHRDELRRPGRNILVALFLPILIGALLGALLAWVLIQYPSLTYYDNLPLVALAEQIHPFLALSILLAMLVFAFIGINESLSSALKLSQTMSQDGFMAENVTIRNRALNLPNVLVIFLAAGAILIIILLQSTSLLSISAVCLLSALVLVNIPDIFRRQLRLPERRWLRVPFHPLVPIITVVMGFTSILLQPLEAQLITLLWAAIGAIYFVGYAREGAVRLRQDKETVSTTAMPLRKTGYRVLAALADPDAALDLVRLSSKLAQARGGNLFLLHVIVTDERNQETEAKAQEALERLNESIAALDPPPVVPIIPQIRLASVASQGILNTLWEEQIDTVVLGWPGLVTDNDEKDETTARVVRYAQSQVIVLRGDWPENPGRLLVPTVSAEHSPAALTLAKNLSDQNDSCRIVALQVVGQKLNSETEMKAKQQLEQTLTKIDDSSGIERQIAGAASIKTGILERAAEHDLLLMGLSDAGYLAPTMFAGIAVAVAEEISTPALLVASQEKTINYWLRRTWDQVTSVIPALTARQQSEVSLAMRLNAKATIDFYVLITLATAIAFLGLMQNSAAVIIGAMLVAPLMSPILAMAHGIVKGRLQMLREAANTTLNGIILAIGIGVLLTFVLLGFGLPLTATSEILARTQPNILDLLVAIASGAVAAYAVSRSEVAGALPGVAIAAALVPPLAVVGFGLGTAQFEIASGSLLLFLTNLAAIVFAAALVFLLLGFRPPPRVGRDEQARFGMKIAIIALLIISIPLLLTTRSSSMTTTRDAAIGTIIDSYWSPKQANVEDIVITLQRNDDLLVEITVFDYAGVVTKESLANLQLKLSEEVNRAVILVAQTVDARQENFDSTRSAIQLSQTPTPTSTPTPTTTSSLGLALEERATILPKETRRPLAAETPAVINTPVPITPAEESS